jgi:hypothetical protein
MARAYELTGNATDKAIVDTFTDVLCERGACTWACHRRRRCGSVCTLCGQLAAAAPPGVTPACVRL